MAASKEQQRRYQAALRRVVRRLQREQPDTYQRWYDEARAEVDAEQDLRSVG